MVRQVLRTSLPLIVYNPAGVCDKNYFSHCARAGALPVFDTEFITDNDAIDFIKELKKENFPYGLRISVQRGDLFNSLREKYIQNCQIIVFYYDSPDEIKGFDIGACPYTVLMEVTDIAINDMLDPIEPHALILRGNEAPGKVSRYTSFILQQWYAENSSFPCFIHGGVGYYTATGMFAAGASGIVLDNQLFLAREAPLSASFKSLIQNLEERDSLELEDEKRVRRRFFSKLGTKIIKQMKKKINSGDYRARGIPLYDEVRSHFVPMNDAGAEPTQSLFYLGQDASFARYFAKNGSAIVDMIQGFFRHISYQLSLIDEHDPLREGSPLAREHGTRYPIMQGPMGNISDNPKFAAQVAGAGALPFYAIGNLPAKIVDAMMCENKKNSTAAGAGLIGVKAMNKFLPEHLDIVKKYSLPFALFAGGVPSQVKDLEEAGTKTYLHTPSRQMLDNALSSGCRRFIFEGREAGGHIGHLTSLVLWELALESVHELSDEKIRGLRLIFAGGIGTPCASHFISGMTSLAAKQGCSVGVQIGTPYLFTKEITETGALTKTYQDMLCSEKETTVIGDTVGLHSRTVPGPFSKRILENEEKRVRDNIPLNERKELFERDNIGALLIGAKGFRVEVSSSGETVLIKQDEKEQYEKGNFMSGDLVACFDHTLSIADIHTGIINSKEALFRNLNELEILFSEKGAIRDDIAIIGMGCVLPDALDPEELWNNIISKKYSIKEMSPQRFDAALYYDMDRKAEDKSYTKLAGQVDGYVFDHTRFGYTEAEADGISRSQKMILDASMKAVEDAGYQAGGKKLPPARTAVIIGTCLTSELNSDLHLKYYYPELRYYLDRIQEFSNLGGEEKKEMLRDLKEGLGQGHKDETPDGAIVSIESARVASHLGVSGINYTVDAACASSLAALDAARKELLSGSHDVVVAGGVNTNLAPESFVGFGQMGALSSEGSFPFDERAGGFILGEGAGAVVLKRMKDALRDGDTIHAVLRGIGSSSDGRGKAIAAPNPEGQKYAFERCFSGMEGGIMPDDIGFVEAHGTSTLMGDYAEIETLKNIYGNSPSLGFSSIKSQIGHLLGGAGLAGLIKAVLSLKHKTLPPNGQYKKLSPRFDLQGTNLFVIEEARKWETQKNAPRRAGVSSFGFGGINYHCVLEEMTDLYRNVTRADMFSPVLDHSARRIVIAGMGVMLPGAATEDMLWSVIKDGRDVLREIPETRFHNAYYTRDEDERYRLPLLRAGVIDDNAMDTRHFRMPPNTAATVDRTQFFSLECARQALEQSGLKSSLNRGNKTAVIVGTMAGEKLTEQIIRTRIPFIEKILKNSKAGDKKTRKSIAGKLSLELKKRNHKNTEDTVPGLLCNIVSGRIANFFGCNGANFIIDASSASSAIAMRLSMLGLRTGDYDNVITGGIDSNLTPLQSLAFREMGMLSSEKSPVFDRNSRGINMSEGGALFVLTTYKNAVEKNMPVLAELNGIGLHGQSSGKMMIPSEASYVEAMKKAGASQPLAGREIDYIDVYGSGYMLFDLIEYQALNKIYKKPLPFGNSKPELGYYRSANPAVVLAKMLLMNKHKSIPMDRNFTAETSIVREASPLKGAAKEIFLNKGPSRRFAANFFGFGGNHGHIIMGTPPLPLFSSAAAAGNDMPETASAVTVTAGSRAVTYSRINSGLVTVLLSGQGSQRSGMMKDLYRNDAKIRAVMDRGGDIFMRERGYSILEMMFGENLAINATENTQPAVFISTAAIYDVLREEGCEPRYFIGHSLGEYSALYCAGVLGFDDAMKLVLKRSDLMHDAAGKVAGGIMVVFKNWIETQELINKSGIQDLYIANKNSEIQSSISGKENSISEFSAFLKGHNIMYKNLPLSGAFHTPLFRSAADELYEYLKPLTFNRADFSRIISNVTARPYPDDAGAVKALLAKQMVSPVEFVESVHYAFTNGAGSFIEAGPNKILINLLKNINLGIGTSIATVDPKIGEIQSFTAARSFIGGKNAAGDNGNITIPRAQDIKDQSLVAASPADYFLENEDNDFKRFLNEQKHDVRRVLYGEFKKYQEKKAVEESKRFGFYTGPIVIAGVSIGLPGSARNVFNDDNFDRIIRGENCIELLTREERDLLLDKNITRVFKKPDGSATFEKITEDKDVIHLSGKPGRFDQNDFAIEFKTDITDALAIAAGVEALRDAWIPLVPNRRRTSTGSVLVDGYALPEEMQGTTGVIRTTILPGYNSVIDEVTRYLENKIVNGPFRDFEKLYYNLMEKIKDRDLKEQITSWFFDLKSKINKNDYTFDKNFVFKLGFMGAAQFAQHIKAKGPNTQTNAACATTTQAIAIAEDWIRNNRCDRVIIIGSESATPGLLGPWLHAVFLALGAGTVKDTIAEAAKPFDSKRNGTIVGSGAVSIIVERGDRVQERGLRGQAEVLGTHMGNSAFHGTSIDVNHVTGEMKRAIDRIEARNGLKKDDYTKSLVFMSHETYTPAHGGSANAEIKAIRESFPDHYRDIVITNTKGFTGHTLGAGIEDPVLIKSLQKGATPPIANLCEVPDEFSDLRFSKGEAGDYRYGIHFSAGFGSQLALAFFRRLEEAPAVNNRLYHTWLCRISGYENPELIINKKTLCVKQQDEKTADLPLEVPAYSLKAEPLLPVPSFSGGTAAGNVSIVADLKKIIAEQTGYSIDMLDDGLDLEADLGIDTVKQVEIFGRISSNFSLDVPEDLKLSDMNTIAKIAAYVAAKIGGLGTGMAPAPAAGHLSFVADLKKIIAEQTGYSIDMLDDGLDLEADLGIDTVKQVEIFGRISSNFSLDVPEDLKLSDMNTIAKIAAYVAAKTGAVEKMKAAPLSSVTPAAEKIQSGGAKDNPRRFTIELKKLGPVEKNTADFAEKVFLITRDSSGFADLISALITKNSGKVISLGTDDSADYKVDLTKPGTLAKKIESVMKAHPDINSLIHLYPIDHVLMGTDLTDDCIESSIKSFFVIIVTLHEKLRSRESIISSLAFNSVVFPYGDNPPAAHPVFAAISGMCKTMDREFKEALVKVVDFYAPDPRAAAGEIAENYIAEILSGDRTVETGFRDGARYGLAVKSCAPEYGEPFINDGSTLLVTGGAAGITFEILCRLAKNYSDLKLIILGRSDIASLETEFLGGVLSEKEIMALLKDRMQGVKPLEIKNAAAGIMRTGQVMRNIEYLKKLGAGVDYHAADVASMNSLRKALKGLKHFDGILHAAGVEESQFIEKKSLDSFNRVFDTKVYGALNLLRFAEPFDYRFFMAFSSVAARFGNEGQIDYSGANEMMGKLLLREKLKHSSRTYKVFDWTAWEGAGMAAKETVKKVLEARGTSFLPLETGIDFFMDELRDSTTAEALFAGAGDYSRATVRDEPHPGSAAPAVAPFLDSIINKDPQSVRFTRTITLDHDLFMKDHSKDGIPLFLGATGIETMAEAAAHLAGKDLRVSELRDFHIPYGIKILKGRPKEIEIEAVKSGDAVRCSITSQFKNPKGRIIGDTTLHYQGTYLFTDKTAKSPVIAVPADNRIEFDGDFQEIIYHPERLFMNGVFRTVRDIHFFDGELLVCSMGHNGRDKEFFSGNSSPDFLIDVVLLDAMFQTGGIFEMLTTCDVILPSKISRMRIYDHPEYGGEYLCLTRKIGSGDESNEYSLTLIDTKGRVYIDIERFEMIKVTRVRKDHRIDGIFKIIA